MSGNPPGIDLFSFDGFCGSRTSPSRREMSLSFAEGDVASITAMNTATTVTLKMIGTSDITISHFQRVFQHALGQRNSDGR